MAGKRNRYRPDTKLRRRLWWSRIKKVTGFFVAVASVLLLSAAFAHAYHLLLNGPWLRLEEVEVTGLSRVERRDVLDALKVPRDANILNLRMAHLARRLDVLPWVRSAVVRLDLPARLVVEVVEREPLFVLYYTDTFYLVDTQGKLFMQVDLQHYPGFLLVTGLTGSELHNGEGLLEEPLEAIRTLLLALEKSQSWLPLNHISQCHWQRDMGFTLYTYQKAIPIQLGKEDFELKFGRLQRVVGALVERQWWDHVTRIDLDYESRAYIKGRFPIPKGI